MSGLPAVMILAGGQSRRMGQDKAFCDFDGTPLIARVAFRLAGQGRVLLVNADEPGRFAGLGFQAVVPDRLSGRLGPLAGILAGLEFLAETGGGEFLVSVPVDLPFVPRDLVRRLCAARAAADADLACAASAGRTHPAAGLWPVRLAGDLRRALEEGVRRIDDWTGRHRRTEVDYTTEPFDPFLNVNTGAELDLARGLARRYAGQVPLSPPAWW